jgi:tetratricopeptide (TPR) repeat protein
MSLSVLQEAILLHQRGALREAGARYSQVLVDEPRNVDALFLLGMAWCQQGQFADALAPLRKVVALAPDRAPAHNLLGIALRRLQQRPEALASFDLAVTIDPGFAEGHANRGDLLGDMGRFPEALASYDRALAIEPNLTAAWCNRGVTLFELGCFDEAIASHDRALAIAPALFASHLNRGHALRALGRLDDALCSLDQALAIHPGVAEIHCGRGTVLKDLRRLEEALASFDRAVALNPMLAIAVFNRANTLLDLGRAPEALAGYEELIAIDPNFAAAWYQRGCVLFARNELQSAVESFEMALRIAPNFAEACSQLGRVLVMLGRYEAALASCGRALALRDDDILAQHTRSVALMRLGHLQDALAGLDRVIATDPDNGLAYADRAFVLNALGHFDQAFADIDASMERASDSDEVRFTVATLELLHGRWHEAWPKYESRWHARSVGLRELANPPFPRWNGEDLPHGWLVLVTEQGAGDAIQFARFATVLGRRGFRVALLTNQALAPLLRTVPGIGILTCDAAEVAALPTESRWLPLMSVPHLLGTAVESIPAEVPYLSADPGRVAAWRERLSSAGFKIGIAWQGNPVYRFDKFRSFELREFRPVAEIPGVRLISLQKGGAERPVGDVAFRVETLGNDYDTTGAFLDCAAVMESLDLIVSVDTAVAHLAGALRRPVFVALGKGMLDWRWLLGRDDSPWYPTMRLFRQSAEGDWAGTFARIADAVRMLAEIDRARLSDAFAVHS